MAAASRVQARIPSRRTGVSSRGHFITNTACISVTASRRTTRTTPSSEFLLKHGQLAGTVHRAQSGLRGSVANLLYLVHRLPYPPNKGDKVRSFNLLRHLASKHRVFLGTFIDDPQDEIYVDKLPAYCADLNIVRLSPRIAQQRSLVATVLPECQFTDVGGSRAAGRRD